MYHIHILCVGKLKEPFYQAAAAEYGKRLGPFCRLEVTELPETRLPDRPSTAQIDDALRREADALLPLIPKGAAVCALCIEGKPCSSEDFSRKLEQLALQGGSRLVFLIGGSFGLHEAVKERAQWRLSLSPMTFPHHLARVLLLEQLYRAFQIQTGTRYHK